MYNVKVVKYPHSWHVRVYSSPVGFSTVPDRDAVDGLVTGEILDGETGEWVSVEYDPRRYCIEPFTHNLARLLPDTDEPDRDRSAASSMNRTKNRVYYLARSNTWDWFVTLTLDPERVDSHDYDVCVKHLKGWIDTVRRTCGGLKYIIVPERHKSGRFHFHGLFACCGGLSFTDSGHRTGGGQAVYNVGRYGLGFSTATAVTDNSRVVQYISKYITKDLCAVSYGRKRYWASRNLEQAEIAEGLFVDAERRRLIDFLSGVSSHSTCFESADLCIRYYEVESGLLSLDMGV